MIQSHHQTETDALPFRDRSPAPDEPPAFPGGMNALMEYISNYISYPSAWEEEKIEARVVFKFVVDKTGKAGYWMIESPEIIKIKKKDQDGNHIISDGDYVYESVETSAFFKEDIDKLFVQMPKWTPGKKNGKGINCYFSLPIMFRKP